MACRHPHSMRRLRVIQPEGSSSADDQSDQLGRPLRDLRVSVTDRCMLRCQYCMPRSELGERVRFVPRPDLLTFEEIERVVRAMVPLGIRKVRLTGGEPLLRADLHVLVRLLCSVGVEVALSTNGVLLAHQAGQLARAGLSRVNVSLDALDPVKFLTITDSRYGPEHVLRGIDEASRVGLGPIKVNVVVRRGVNDDQVLPLAEHFRGSGHVVRFIEFMDAGTSNGWTPETVISSKQILEVLNAAHPLEPVLPDFRSEVAHRWRYLDGAGEIGLIASVSQPFCRDCSRLRLSSDGQLHTCLFASRGHDIRTALRRGASVDELRALVARLWQGRDDRYSELRHGLATRSRREMSYLGG